MGQSEIVKILKEKKGVWISTIDLGIRLKQTSSVITKSLNQMFKYGEVEKKKLPIEKNPQHYVLFWKIEDGNK